MDIHLPKVSTLVFMLVFTSTAWGQTAPPAAERPGVRVIETQAPGTVGESRPGPIWVPVPRKIERPPQTTEPPPPPLGDVLEQPIVVLGNGDLRGRNMTVRLDGVEPIDLSRLCTDATGRRWTCALRARGALVTAIDGRTVRCKPTGTDREVRIATCTIGDKSLALDLVRQGWLVPTAIAPQDIADAGARAKTERRGIWSTQAP